MTRPRTNKPPRARRPTATEWIPPNPEDLPLDPPQIVPEDLVESVMLRLDHAVRWGNWSMVERVLEDARRQSHEIAHEAIRPVEERPVECLRELAGIPVSLITPLRLVNHYAREPVTVGQVLCYGRARLAGHDAYRDGRAAILWAAIKVARRQIERQLQALTCWSTVC